MHTVHVPQVSQVEVVVDKGYKMNAFKKCTVEVRNLALEGEDVRAANPVDGKLECVLRTPSKGLFKKNKLNTSIVPAKDLQMTLSNSVKCIADGEEFESNELRFKIIPKALRVITGKGRKF